jgi:hypothetical protein
MQNRHAFLPFQFLCSFRIFSIPYTLTADLILKQLGFSEFEMIMKAQIKLYVQRQLSNTLIAGADSRFEVCGVTNIPIYLFKMVDFSLNTKSYICI